MSEPDPKNGGLAGKSLELPGTSLSRFARVREQFGKVFLGVLFTSLGRLANLLANRLPLIRLVFFDRVKQILTFVLCEFCVVHILVPMLLHTPFGALRK